MGPKKEKSDVPDEEQWKRDIENAVLNDDTFSVKVVIMDGMGSEHDKIYLSKFEEVAKKERRYVIKNICKTETIFMVNQLGADKKGKDDSMRLFEEVYSFTKEKKDIPAEFLALLVKKLVIKMKDDYVLVRRQKLEVREGLRQESAIMIDRAVVKGNIHANREHPDPPAEPVNPPPISPEEDKKYNTVLREKGEEWRDRVYVDDYPIDGPHSYVAISGFEDPLLPCALIKIGVPISAVIQIRINPYTTQVPVSFLEAAKRRQLTSNEPEQTATCWEDLQKNRIHPDTADVLKHTAFIIFSPPYSQKEALSEDPDKIYDEISYLMYDIQDLTRQHQHYLDNMDIQRIPQYTENVKYFNSYQNRIGDLPLESLTIYTILDAMLEATTKKIEHESRGSVSSVTTPATSILPHPTSIHHSDTLTSQVKVEKAEKIVTDVLNRLCQAEETQKAYRTTYGEEYETHKDPIIIKYGDNAGLNTFHIENIDLHNIVVSTLSGMPVNQLWHHQQKRPELELEAKVNFHVNVLLSCFEREDVESSELNRLVHILACKKLYTNRSSLKKKHLGVTTIDDLKKSFLKRSILAEPLYGGASSTVKDSFSCPSFTRIESESAASIAQGSPETNRIEFLFDCPDISELVTPTDIASKQSTSNVIDDYEFFEDFTEGAALQIMLDAFNKFNCVDYKYCEVTDCIVLMFFNSHDQDGMAREQWRSHLPTPVCLQDFFDFILDEQYEWIQNEENIYEELLVINKVSSLQVQSPDANCIEDSDVESEMLMEGSLKHQVRIAEASSSFSILSPTETNYLTSIDQKSEAHSISPKGDKKDTLASTKKSKRLQPTVLEPFVESEIALVKKHFCGYDLGDRRFETIGKDSTFFSRDGTKVKIQYTLSVPMNDEHVSLNVLPGNGTDEFWIHKVLSDRSSSKSAEVSESFRVVTKDQIMINVKKQTYEVPIILNDSTDDAFKTEISGVKLSNSKAPAPPSSPVASESTKKMSYHSLYITWPNGQISETVHVENSSDVSHIKQMFLTNSPFNDEDMRCISMYGEVVIFKKSGVIEVLRPGGIRILITNYSKRVDRRDSKPYAVTLSPTKIKKGKNPIKTNESKTQKSKIAVQAEDTGKVHPYVLDIRDFEITETSGLKQLWCNDTHTNIEKLFVRTAVDYCTGEIFSRRMDGTNCFINKDGIQIVTFPDKTRIITEYLIEDEEIFPEWTEAEREELGFISDMDMSTSSVFSQNDDKPSAVGSDKIDLTKKYQETEYITEISPKRKAKRQDGYVSIQIIYAVENSHFATVTVNKQKGNVSISSPNKTCITVDSNNHYNISLENAISANFDGSNLNIDYESCPECKTTAYCDVNMTRSQEPECKSEESVPRYWLKMKDSYGKEVFVNDEGDMTVGSQNVPTEQTENAEAGDCVSAQEPELNAEDAKSDAKCDSTSMASVGHSKCKQLSDEKGIRFFVLRRDLSCSELVHRTLLAQYQQTCRWLPWCSINQYDTYGDHRTLWSLLTPILHTETEKWQMESKLTPKPKNLTYGDLKPDAGKGFYQWMRPYERYTPKSTVHEPVLPPRLPRAFVLRTLEQQWKENEREELKGGRELIRAILKYREMMTKDCETLLHVPIIDPRTEQEKMTDQLVQEIGQKVCRDLAKRLKEDLRQRAVVDITTKPVPVNTPKVCDDEEFEDKDSSVQLPVEEEISLIEELEKVVPISPKLERYWRKRAEELKEEKFYQYLLRQTSVPPYFLGSRIGAIWWELNKTVEHAVSVSERRKTTCVCAELQPKADADEMPLLM